MKFLITFVLAIFITLGVLWYRVDKIYGEGNSIEFLEIEPTDEMTIMWEGETVIEITCVDGREYKISEGDDLTNRELIWLMSLIASIYARSDAEVCFVLPISMERFLKQPESL